MEHSLAVSHLAQQIAKSHSDNKDLAEDALLAGLLHDVGQLLLAANLQEQYGRTLALARENDISLCDAEFECLGAHHGNVGAYLLGLWGLADPIVEAVAFHHQPTKCMADGFGPLTAVHVANILANEARASRGITYSLDIDVDYVEQCGVAGQLPKWREMAENFCAARV